MQLFLLINMFWYRKAACSLNIEQVVVAGGDAGQPCLKLQVDLRYV